MIFRKYLFNFSASYIGGGYKRLYEFSKGFNLLGGAYFIIHPKCESLKSEFPNNKYIFVYQSLTNRFLNDSFYLQRIVKEIGSPDLYYSYGIPIYNEIGKVNWFHLSNVLPITAQNIPLSRFTKAKMKLLGYRIRKNYYNANIISAESEFSLGLIDIKERHKLFLSVNGSDDELNRLEESKKTEVNSFAVVVGTYQYKAIDDSYRIFKMLKMNGHENLKLVIIGDKKFIPSFVMKDEDVFATGLLPRKDVITYLKDARFYISTTLIENSYNAASEGIFFAEESYISNIGPHQELLKNMPYLTVNLRGVKMQLMFIRKDKIDTSNLKKWNDVIDELIQKVESVKKVF